MAGCLDRVGLKILFRLGLAVGAREDQLSSLP